MCCHSNLTNALVRLSQILYIIFQMFVVIVTQDVFLIVSVMVMDEHNSSLV
jgi:hypothetical protein